MRPVWALAAFLGCSGGPIAPKGRLVEPPGTSTLAEEDRYIPTYSKAELQKALIAERGAEATGERVVTELEAKPEHDAATEQRLRTAIADLAVRRQFIAALEECEANGRWCPPRLDDPPFEFDQDGPRAATPALDTRIAYDLDSWRKIAVELHGRACACRTIACVDSVGVAIDMLELRPAIEAQGDETASWSITRARECLFRLRGKQHRARQLRQE